jgi:hypothetical protein
VSALVALGIAVYAALVGCSFSLPSYTVWGALTQDAERPTELVALQTYTLLGFIRMCFESDALMSATLISLLSGLWSVALPVLVLVGWFAKLRLRTRARMLLWVNRLGRLMLFYFVFVHMTVQQLVGGVRMPADPADSSEDSSEGVFFVLVGQADWAVFCFFMGAVLLLVLCEWVYVLHYNCTLWRATCAGVSAPTGASAAPGDRADGVALHSPGGSALATKWYFGNRDGLCQALCCVPQLQRGIPLPKQRPPMLVRSRSTGRDLQQAWRIQGSTGLQEAGGGGGGGGGGSALLRRPVPFSTTVTDIEFLRGNYRYSCSSLGLVLLGLWSCAVVILGTLSLVYPYATTQVQAFDSQGVLIADVTNLMVAFDFSRYLRDVDLADFTTGPAWPKLMGMIALSFLVVAIVPLLAHLLTMVALFVPVRSVCGNRTLRLVCHVSNLLVLFSCYEVQVLCYIVMQVDLVKISAGILQDCQEAMGTGQSWRQNQTEDGRLCFETSADGLFNTTDVDVTICAIQRPAVGLTLGVLAVLMLVPYQYYYAETYHRHYGLVMDGRNQQAYSTGETTHKHRAEGCLVLGCYHGFCCTRHDYTFRQESVDEDEYYGDPGTAGSSFMVPSALFTKTQLEASDLAQA